MKYLLDTNMVSYYLQGAPAVVRHLERTPDGFRYICLISIGELYYGCYRSARIEKNLATYRRFFQQTKMLPFTEAVASRFGEVKAGLARQGQVIEDHDIWIAAHALEHGITLVTNNERDFSRIPRLKIENWSK